MTLSNLNHWYVHHKDMVTQGSPKSSDQNKNFNFNVMQKSYEPTSAHKRD